MCRSRQKAIIDILAQFDATNFALRKRMFETKYVLDELVWQKEMVVEIKKVIVSRFIDFIQVYY